MKVCVEPPKQRKKREEMRKDLARKQPLEKAGALTFQMHPVPRKEGKKKYPKKKAPSKHVNGEDVT